MSKIEAQNYHLKNKVSIIIRTARPEDAEQVLALTQSVIRTASFLLTTKEEFHLTQEIQTEFLDSLWMAEGKLAILAEYDGQVVGFLDFHNGRKIRNQHKGSFGMSVKEDFRGMGIGKALLEQLMKWAKAHNLIEKLSLEVFSKNKPAMALYEKAGFKEEGRQRKAIKYRNDSYDDLIIMSCFTK
ncbi:GNAT family N-acetyltransferase [Halobacillus salinus]|uniref:GNAT family N-acetyltransferase n=1 Tax=Halobacillus salinus TaxID=192814 RepID=UPI0009A837A5|nr:GNAT family protein [Halobacillus salinus]